MEFLVDLGSLVTAVSNSFYQTLIRTVPPLGVLRLEGLTLFADNTSLIVGRTLVNPSRWKVPVLVSFSQDTVMVAPFSEVGMIVQVSAIQSIMEPLHRPQGDADSLPAHLRDLLDQTSRALDTTQQRRLVDVLLQYLDPGVDSHRSY